MVGGLVLLALLWWGYTLSSHAVTLEINGQPHQIQTHHLKVETILNEMGLQLQPEDIITPLPENELAPGDTLSIRLARPVTINADGQTRQILTHQQTVQDTLAEAGHTLNPRDEVFINNQIVPPKAPLPQPEITAAENARKRLLAATTPKGAAAEGRAEPMEIVVRRSVPVTLREEQANSRFYSARATVGEALEEQGVTLFPEDIVSPTPETPLAPGMTIFVQRSTPLTVKTDGLTLDIRTHGETVGHVLAQEELVLMGQDFVRPAADTPIAANDVIEIVRVREGVEIAEEYIDFETEWVADDTMELDQQEVRQEGQTGVIKTRTRVRYENEQEIWREFEDEWLDKEPETRVIAYGTNVVVRTVDTPDGPIEYWRKIPMRATAYSAATSGKSSDHPLYGITRSGLEAGFGIVAVDPRVIPLMTNLYIEDYGPAVAGDTGGRILGRHIDLGFPDDQPLPVIFDWRYVYVRTPVPNPDRIRYVLPNWPQRN